MGGDRVEAGAERRAHRAGGGVGPGEHHLGGDAVVVELLVAGRGVPPAAQADLVEAVALLVLAEPLLLELVVADEVAGRLGAARRSSMSALPLGELVVEVVAVLRVEEVAVHGRVRARVAVGRDDDVVRPRSSPLGCQTFAGACSRNAMLAAPSGTASSPAVTSSTRGPNCAASGASCSRSKP